MIWEELNKRMPFHEDKDYVKGLIEKSTDRAVAMGSSPARHIPLRRVAMVAAASVALLFVVTLVYKNLETEKPIMAKAREMNPLDLFLNSISDEEAKQIEYYEVE